jgi:hypothetical protein
LAEPCALDLLPVLRSVVLEDPRTAVDCTESELIPVDPMDMAKSLCLLGKQQTPTCCFARGKLASAKGSSFNLNLRTWSKMLVGFNLAMG